MLEETLIVLCTCPDQETADRLTNAMLTERAAACVNVGAPVTSHYRWKDNLEQATEVPLTIKTCSAAYPRLEQLICELHPYEVPEIVALPVSAGLPDYLKWVNECTD